jgi:hypothetical protein
LIGKRYALGTDAHTPIRFAFEWNNDKHVPLVIGANERLRRNNPCRNRKELVVVDLDLDLDPNAVGVRVARAIHPAKLSAKLATSPRIGDSDWAAYVATSWTWTAATSASHGVPTRIEPQPRSDTRPGGERPSISAPARRRSGW